MLVRTLEQYFGENAGKIWRALNKYGALSEKKLIKVTKLKHQDVSSGIGWLAREDKVSKDSQGYYRLGETNLTSKIGSDAGRIWKIMDIWGEVNFPTMKRLAEIDEIEIYAALGWLARENKVDVNENQMFNLI
jgi:hypothetical protein